VRAGSRDLVWVAAAAAVLACQEDAPLPPGQLVATGTWGGEDAGLIVQQSQAHAHIGCTFGDFAAPIALARDGRFTAEGSYVLRAYPVAVGPPLPATFSGVVRGQELTLGVVVNDTVADEHVVLGPVSLVLGRDPRMGPCPICLEPAAMR
jgi:hypothetical protein